MFTFEDFLEKGKELENRGEFVSNDEIVNLLSETLGSSTWGIGILEEALSKSCYPNNEVVLVYVGGKQYYYTPGYVSARERQDKEFEEAHKRIQNSVKNSQCK